MRTRDDLATYTKQFIDVMMGAETKAAEYDKNGKNMDAAEVQAVASKFTSTTKGMMKYLSLLYQVKPKNCPWDQTEYTKYLGLSPKEAEAVIANTYVPVAHPNAKPAAYKAKVKCNCPPEILTHLHVYYKFLGSYNIPKPAAPTGSGGQQLQACKKMAAELEITKNICTSRLISGVCFKSDDGHEQAALGLIRNYNNRLQTLTGIAACSTQVSKFKELPEVTGEMDDYFHNAMIKVKPDQDPDTLNP